MTDVGHRFRTNERQHLVQKAVSQWRSELIDAATDKVLLHFDHSGFETLDVSHMCASASSALFGGEEVHQRELFADGSGSGERLRALWRSAWYQQRQRGIHCGYLTLGVATWRDQDDHPVAPVLLYPLHIEPVDASHRDFQLRLDNEPVVNALLIHHLSHECGIDISIDQFPIPRKSNPEALLDRVTNQLRRAADSVDEFSVNPSRAICAFTYSAFAMDSDLDPSNELLTGNDVVAALSGDPDAQRVVSSSCAAPAIALDQAAFEHEYAIVDADSAQNSAIGSAINGEHVVIDSATGSGKTQTITNLLSSLVARGQRVLFLAGSSSSVGSVKQALRDSNLDSLALDARSDAGAVQQVQDRLTTDEIPTVERPDLQALHGEVTAVRQRLLAHDHAVHGKRQPWHASEFDLQCRVADTPQWAQVSARLGQRCLDQLSPEAAARTAAQLRHYAEAGGFELTSTDTSWWGAQLPDNATASAAAAVAHRLSQTWRRLNELQTKLNDQIGPLPTATIAQWREHLDFLQKIHGTGECFSEPVWSFPLNDWVAATATTKWRKENAVKQTWRQRRKHLKAIQRIWQHGTFDVRAAHESLASAAADLAHWRKLGLKTDTPFSADTAVAAGTALRDFETGLDQLASIFPTVDPRSWPLALLTDWLVRLVSDRDGPVLMQRLHGLRCSLVEAGFGDLMTELDTRHADVRTSLASFEYCVSKSLLEQIRRNDDQLTKFDSRQVHRDTQRFIQLDAAHIAANSARVGFEAAQRIARARRLHPTTQSLLRKQFDQRRGRATLRKLLQDGSELLLELTPIVVMSPLAVAELLPKQRLFDVVVFDDAETIRICDAIPAIMRASRVAVCGDSRQLHPCIDPKFPMTSASDPSTESLLQGMKGVLASRTLTSHYRSRDERLFQFAHERSYGTSLITFPGQGKRHPLGHELVQVKNDSGPPESSQAEVDWVIRMIVDHAYRHPDHSLGVVTMSAVHAQRIQSALDKIRTSNVSVDSFFSHHREEPFIITDMSTAYGEYRDTIWISLGQRREYLDSFSAPATDGAVAAINIATTLARHQIVTVSTFDSADVVQHGDKDSLAALLVGYLQIHNAGQDTARSQVTRKDLTYFDTDIVDSLVSAGIPVTTHCDGQGHRLTFIAAHPNRPDEAVLAIEADGAAAYADKPLRDRLRLRGQVLENIGFRVHRILSQDWWNDKAAEVAKVRNAYDSAVAASDNSHDQWKPTRPPLPRTAYLDACAPQSADRSTCPVEITGGPITDYSLDQLVALMRWIRSDSALLSNDQLQSAAREVLGFKRRGRRIEAALNQAIAATAKANLPQQ